MRITATPLVVLLGVLLPAVAAAEEAPTSFAARWPETTLRKPSMNEMVHLMVTASKDEITSAVKAELGARQLKPVRCTLESCGIPGTR